jgi:3-hydroxybutyryl-CoA dehydratase
MNEVILNSTFEFVKTFSAEDVNAFASLTEDNNPIHIDEEYASHSIFKQRVVHGVLLVSMFSKIFGTIYPGNGGIYMSQTSKFLRPAFIGDEITAKATLTEFDNIKKRGTFLCEAFNQKNELLLTGEAKILFPDAFELVS